MRVPIHPAAGVRVAPAVYGAGYMVGVRWTMGAPNRPRDIEFYAVDLAGVALVLAHVFEGRHCLGDTVAGCPACALDRALRAGEGVTS